MKNFVSAGSFLVLALLLALSLAGCGGVSANPKPSPSPTPTPMPTPPGATPTPTPAAAHGTFVYVNNTTSVTGFRLNPDGTLSQLAGSPFAIQGFISTTGSFMLVFSGTSISTYQVDPASGVPSFVSNVNVPGASGGVGDAHNLYVQGNIPNSNLIGFYGFAISSSGMLTPVAGSPFVFGQACDFCDAPESMALNDNFLIVGGVGFHGVGDFTVYARGPGGVLGQPKSSARTRKSRLLSSIRARLPTDWIPAISACRNTRSAHQEKQRPERSFFSITRNRSWCTLRTSSCWCPTCREWCTCSASIPLPEISARSGLQKPPGTAQAD